MPGKPIVMCDLDSTVCDTRPRWEFSPYQEDRYNTWEDYAMQCWRDEPVRGVIQVLKMLHSSHEIHLVSGREGCSTQLTKKWLGDHLVPYDVLRLRCSDDHYDIVRYKVTYAKQLLDDGRKIDLMIEDWPQMRAAFEGIGIPCLIVGPPFRDKQTPHTTF